MKHMQIVLLLYLQLLSLLLLIIAVAAFCNCLSQWRKYWNWQEWSAKLLCRCSGTEWLWVQGSRSPAGQWRSVISVALYSRHIQMHCREVCEHKYMGCGV